MTDTTDTEPDSHAAAGLAALLNLNHPIKRATSEWARAELTRDGMVDRDRDCVFDRRAWQACARYGILGASVPIAYGGTERSLVESLLMLEGLGHGCRDNGLVFGITSQMWSTQTVIANVGTEEQKEQWLPGLVSGEILGAFAITEPDSGSDTYALATRAEALNDGSYRLEGHKAWLTLGSEADLVVVFATIDPDSGPWGVTAFIVDTSARGVEIVGNREKMGMRTTPFGDITLHDVVVSETDRLGPEGGGIGIFTDAMEAERAYVLAGQIGSMERQIEEAVEYARTRKQFGKSIGKFQAVSHRIADMKVRHEVSRVLMYKVALAQQSGRRTTMDAAIAKLVASEAAVESGLDATRVFGAKGYVSEFEIERDLRDFVGGLIYSGTSDIQKNIIAQLLGVG